MKIRTIKKILCLSLLLLGTISFISIHVALADVTYKLQIPLPEFPNSTIDLCTGNNNSLSCSGIAKYLAFVYKWLIGLAVVLGVGALTIAGLLWLTARGETKQVDTSRSIVKNTMWGIVLTLCSYVVLYTLNPQLVTFGPLDLDRIKQMKLEIEQTPIDNPSAPNNQPVQTMTPKKVTDRINQNLDVYKKIAQEADIPWQLLAGIHYQEAANVPNKSLLNGFELCNNRDGSRCSACDNGETLENDARCAAIVIKSKARKHYSTFHAYSDRDTTFTLSQTLNDTNDPHGAYANISMRYNGVCPKLPGSPRCVDITDDAYVMNNFDASHTRMDFCAFKSGTDHTLLCKNWGTMDGFLVFTRKLWNPANFDASGKLVKMD